MSNVVAFWHGPFSQWFYSPFKARPLTLPMELYEFQNCEQYMMFEKAVLFGDMKTANKIMGTGNPKTIKALGREVQGFDEKTWEQHREAIVYNGNLRKFATHENLKQMLLNTKDKIIVEASPFDRIWGVGLSADNPAINDPKKWQGKNLLGIALMKVREELRKNVASS